MTDHFNQLPPTARRGKGMPIDSEETGNMGQDPKPLLKLVVRDGKFIGHGFSRDTEKTPTRSIASLKNHHPGLFDDVDSLPGPKHPQGEFSGISKITFPPGHEHAADEDDAERQRLERSGFFRAPTPPAGSERLDWDDVLPHLDAVVSGALTPVLSGILSLKELSQWVAEGYEEDSSTIEISEETPTPVAEQEVKTEAPSVEFIQEDPVEADASDRTFLRNEEAPALIPDSELMIPNEDITHVAWFAVGFIFGGGLLLTFITILSIMLR